MSEPLPAVDSRCPDRTTMDSPNSQSRAEGAKPLTTKRQGLADASASHILRLAPDARNARKHGPRNAEMIERSISREGFGRSVLLYVRDPGEGGYLRWRLTPP